jgi:hypothetical protein
MMPPRQVGWEGKHLFLTTMVGTARRLVRSRIWTSTASRTSELGAPQDTPALT